MQKPVALQTTEYYSKVYGGWLGKNIGGTLGMPFEGTMEPLDLSFYTQISDGPVPNDDLDLQLVWLHALEQYGARLTAKELGQEWLDHIYFAFDEYGYALANLRRGLKPPVAGWFNNPFTDCMGAPIRSEIWAMIAPGAPEVAVWYAYQDALVDHAGGEGVYGELFFTAIESAAFVEQDARTLITIGLSFIPEKCLVSQAVRDLLVWFDEGKSWEEARACILQHYGNANFTHAPQNIAFTILGWLYGADFGDAIVKAVRCGYDTDCTGATLGAILGIIGGKDALPERWVQPVGDRVAVSPAIRGFAAPHTLDELTMRTWKVAQEVTVTWALPTIDVTGMNNDPLARTMFSRDLLNRSTSVKQFSETDLQSNHYLLPAGSTKEQSLELSISYGPLGPSIGKNQSKPLTFTLKNVSYDLWEGYLELLLPPGWSSVPHYPFQLQPGCTLTWEEVVEAGEQLAPFYDLAIQIVRFHDGSFWSKEKVDFTLVAATHWTVWGPGETQERQKCVFPGNALPLTDALGTEEPGVYHAATTLFNPREQAVRLIVATDSPVTVSLNGERIIDDPEPSVFIPAFHRIQEERYAAIILPAGHHQLTIEVTKNKNPLQLFVLPIAPDASTQTGPHYYLTDILFIDE